MTMPPSPLLQENVKDFVGERGIVDISRKLDAGNIRAQAGSDGGKERFICVAVEERTVGWRLVFVESVQRQDHGCRAAGHVDFRRQNRSERGALGGVGA